MRAGKPQVYSIAAHRGFADALVAGLVPRYFEPDVGLARLTLLLPSTRAVRTVTEAFIRHSGQGLLMPRMAVVGDLDLDETLGPLLDPLGATTDIPPAVDRTYRWLRVAEMIREERGADAPRGAALLRLAGDLCRTMDRLLVEEIGPEELLHDRVLDLLGDLSDHWRASLHLFSRIQTRWLAELEAKGEVDAADRRGQLLRRAARKWRDEPPATPIVAAGVTSAAKAVAALLRCVARLPEGAVVLPDLDLSLDAQVWEELGAAGAPDADPPFGRGDAVTHPQYHLKLLLNRMNVSRDEVQPWHRAGLGKGPPERSHTISSLFLPPEASKTWNTLPPEKRRLAGVRLLESANPEDEAQSIALMVREALETPEKRVAVVTPDRSLAGRIVQHLRRWNIVADDTAGRPLSQTPAGRLMLLLAEAAADELAPVSLMALLEHPLAGAADRERWLRRTRQLDRRLRGPRPSPGLSPLRQFVVAIAKTDNGAGEWWQSFEDSIVPLLAFAETESAPLSAMLDALVAGAENLCGEAVWAREDGRALARFVEDLRPHAEGLGTRFALSELPSVLRDAMDQVAVRPPYGGHPRVAIYGLLESRMTRAELVICAGLNEGSWPAAPSVDALLAPAVLRALGVPGSDFRIGLAAHDLAGALGAPEVVLSRAARDAQGPTIPSRFLLRVRALLGELVERHEEGAIPLIAEALDRSLPAEPYPRPRPMPDAEQRKVDIRVTALDRLRSDPYQFYADAILGLKRLDGLDDEPSAAWQGTVAHGILEEWHRNGGDMEAIADAALDRMNAHPLMRGLWRPRLMAALEWVGEAITTMEGRKVAAWETKGEWTYRGVTVRGRADRIDRLDNGELAIIDYKTGKPPSAAMVEEGYALQLGLIGLMARGGAFEGIEGEPSRFEYWSLAKQPRGEGFGYVDTPILEGRKQRGVPAEDFLPETERYLAEAIDCWIQGNEPFTARLNPDVKVYTDYDQLMRLEEWFPRIDEQEGGS